MLNNIKTTQEYFNLTIDELLEIKNKYGYTREECKLFDAGATVTFFDDEKEFAHEMKNVGGFQEYMDIHKYEIKAILKTINERIAVVLI